MNGIVTVAAQKVLSEDEMTFVSVLLLGGTIKAASEAVGINPNTGTAWHRKKHIKAALIEGKKAEEAGRMTVTSEFHAERTRLMMPAIADKLSEAVSRGVDVVIGIMNNTESKDCDRLNAFKEIVKLSGAVEQQTVVQTAVDSKPKGLSNEAVSEIRRKVLGVE